jgi:hypothetical protein
MQINSMHAAMCIVNFYGSFSDVDECSQSSTDPCAGIGGICRNTIGNYSCSCPRGKQMMGGM